MTAPVFRAVDQHTGTIAEAVAENNRLTRERDDAIAERDNMVNFGRDVGRLSDYLQHMIADRDDLREQRDEYRDRHNEAQCRLDEMAAEIRELQTALAEARNARDTVTAVNS